MWAIYPTYGSTYAFPENCKFRFRNISYAKNLAPPSIFLSLKFEGEDSVEVRSLVQKFLHWLNDTSLKFIFHLFKMP